MPTGPWPNAPSDQCLPVSILVQRNALVLPIQFHLPDKSLPEKWFWAHFDLSGLRVNQDPDHEIAGLEYLFANKKDFAGDDNARQKLGSVLI